MLAIVKRSSLFFRSFTERRKNVHDPDTRPPYTSYSMSDENLYANGGPSGQSGPTGPTGPTSQGLMKLPETSPIYSNRQEILNAATYQQAG